MTLITPLLVDSFPSQAYPLGAHLLHVDFTKCLKHVDIYYFSLLPQCILVCILIYSGMQTNCQRKNLSQAQFFWTSQCTSSPFTLSTSNWKYWLVAFVSFPFSIPVSCNTWSVGFFELPSVLVTRCALKCKWCIQGSWWSSKLSCIQLLMLLCSHAIILCILASSIFSSFFHTLIRK